MARFVAPGSGSADLTVALCADPVRACLSRGGRKPRASSRRCHLSRPHPDARRTIRLGRLERRSARRARREDRPCRPVEEARVGIGSAEALHRPAPAHRVPRPRGHARPCAAAPDLRRASRGPSRVAPQVDLPAREALPRRAGADALPRLHARNARAGHDDGGALHVGVAGLGGSLLRGGRGSRHPRLDRPAADGRRRVSQGDDQARAGRGARARDARSPETPLRGDAALRALVHARAARRVRRPRPREEPARSRRTSPSSRTSARRCASGSARSISRSTRMRAS